MKKKRVITEEQRQKKNHQTQAAYREKNPVVKAVRGMQGNNLGERYPLELRSFTAMRSRCNNPNQLSYQDYGAKGVKVCGRWAHFANFIADMGPKPGVEYTIDRIDCNGNYEPDNCRWATPEQQAVNKRNSVAFEVNGEKVSMKQAEITLGLKKGTIASRRHQGITDTATLLSKHPLIKRNSILVSHEGLTMPVRQWAIRSGIKYTTLLYRLKAKWPVEKLFS